MTITSTRFTASLPINTEYSARVAFSLVLLITSAFAYLALNLDLLSSRQTAICINILRSFPIRTARYTFLCCGLPVGLFLVRSWDSCVLFDEKWTSLGGVLPQPSSFNFSASSHISY